MKRRYAGGVELSVNRVIRTASGEDAAVWRRALEAPGVLDGAAVLKEDVRGGSWVRRVSVMGRDVVVKCRALNTLGRKIKHAVGMGHGQKHWRGAERLMGAGIATGKPLVLGRAVVDGAACEVLVLEWVEGKTLLEVLDEIARGVGPGVREQHAIARAVGTGLRDIVRNGTVNRDHKPSNLIVSRTPSDGVQIAVIDCVGVRRLPRGDDVLSQRMVASAIIESIGTGCVPRRGLWLRALWEFRGIDEYPERNEQREELRDGVWSISRIVQLHGDPRPQVDPLGRR